MRQTRKVIRYGKRSSPMNVVCIPAVVCRQLGIVPGMNLFFKIKDDTIILSKEPFEEIQTEKDDTMISSEDDKFW